MKAIYLSFYKVCLLPEYTMQDKLFYRSLICF